MQVILRSIFLLLLFTTALARGADAQDTTNRFDDLPGRLKTGDQVTVVRIDGDRSSGRVIDLSATAITIATARQPQGRAFPAIEVGRILRTDSVRNGVRIGAIIGGVAGLVGGLTINAICVNETGGCPGIILGLAGGGLMGGAAAGWGLDSAFGNRVVFQNPTALTLPSEHTTEFFGSLMSGRTDTGSRYLSASAGLGRRYASGIGIEAEVSRTLGSGLKHVECVSDPAFQGGRCVGSGEEGTESMFTGTARVVYTFSRSRVQPFVTGGFAVLRSVDQDVYLGCCIANPRIIQTRYWLTRMAAPVGGGVRLAITPSIAIRPEFTYYAGQEGQYRASVGIVYQLK